LVFEHIADLDALVKLYAPMIYEEVDVQRFELHSRICELLGVKYEDFNPFGNRSIRAQVFTEKEAERILWKAIGELKKKQEMEKKC